VTAQPRASWWTRFTRELWRDLRDLVRIQNLERPEMPLLTPAQTYFLRENLKLRLLGARLALLAHDEKSFKADLRAAQDWLTRYYDARDKSVASALATVRQLSDSQIRIETAGRFREPRCRAQLPPDARARPLAGRFECAGCSGYWGCSRWRPGAALALRFNTGLALLVWPPYRVELSLNLLLLLFVISFAAIYLLLRFIFVAIELPQRVREFRARRRREERAQVHARCAARVLRGRYGRARNQRQARSTPGRRRCWARCWRRMRRTSCAGTSSAMPISARREAGARRRGDAHRRQRRACCSTSAGFRTR
jgi:hypothetical protein